MPDRFIGNRHPAFLAYERACQADSEAYLRSSEGQKATAIRNAKRVLLLALAEYQECRSLWAVDRSRGIKRNLPILERLTDLRRWVQVWHSRAEGKV
jgi:hypothetical protein